MILLSQMSDSWQKMLGVIEQYRPIQDTLDILVVAFIIYKAIQLVRETRAGQLIKGIILIAVAYATVTLLGMRSMSYILKYITDSALFLIVILFQPEIRRALEQIGRSSISKFSILGFRSAEEEQKRKQIEFSIMEICSACMSMSEKKIGALIVFEKSTMLGDIIKTGTIVNAEPTAEIVGNIFFPKAPLHDGAMIVREGKIYAAGCILPLTQNMRISRELGTRHRAALGMSEESDAIVVIVSEETGVISVAKAGVLTRDLVENTLREYLVTELLGNAKETNAGEKKRFLGGFLK